MKILVHVLAIKTLDSRSVFVSAHPNERDAVLSLVNNHSDDDDSGHNDFEQGMQASHPEAYQKVRERAGGPVTVIDLPIDVVIQGLEAYYHIQVDHDINEVEVPAPLADPTPLLEYVGKARHERYLASPENLAPAVLNKPWEDLSMDIKRQTKQAVADNVYDVLNGLFVQGTIGGIVNG